MIEVTLKEVVNAVEPLRRVLSTKMPVKAAYHLSRIGDKLESTLRTFEAARSKRIKELGVETSDKLNFMIIDPEQQKVFQAEQDVLLAEVIKIDKEPFSLSQLGNGVELTPADLMALNKILVE